MSRRRPDTATRLMSAIGVTFAEIRTMTVITPAERVAQSEGEYVLQTLLKSPLLVERLAAKMDEVR